MKEKRAKKSTIPPVKIRTQSIFGKIIAGLTAIKTAIQSLYTKNPIHLGKVTQVVTNFVKTMRIGWQNLNRWVKVSLLAMTLLLTIFTTGTIVYKAFYGPAVIKNATLFIHDKDQFGEVMQLLKASQCLTNLQDFERFAKLKDYPEHIKPGSYKIESGWSIARVVQLLRSGAQTPVMVIFNNIRTLEELAGRLSKQLQSDSLSFLMQFRNDSNVVQMGFKPATLPSLFIPNTYSFYWTTTPAGFLNRMKREYDLFWNDTRKTKAREAGLTPEEVATLASIVQEESNKNDEKPVIAGVYLNRLRNKWPLQADPTIRFSLGDFTIHRILTAHLSVVNPYNTYLNTGLPPGPINIPEISSLESVLNFAKHEYFYFCAREDFSGYHNFARTLSDHNRNARKYQEALNKMKVFK